MLLGWYRGKNQTEVLFSTRFKVSFYELTAKNFVFEASKFRFYYITFVFGFLRLRIRIRTNYSDPDLDPAIRFGSFRIRIRSPTLINWLYIQKVFVYFCKSFAFKVKIYYFQQNRKSSNLRLFFLSRSGIQIHYDHSQSVFPFGFWLLPCIRTVAKALFHDKIKSF